MRARRLQSRSEVIGALRGERSAFLCGFGGPMEPVWGRPEQGLASRTGRPGCFTSSGGGSPSRRWGQGRGGEGGQEGDRPRFRAQLAYRRAGTRLSEGKENSGQVIPSLQPKPPSK